MEHCVVCCTTGIFAAVDRAVLIELYSLSFMILSLKSVADKRLEARIIMPKHVKPSESSILLNFFTFSELLANIGKSFKGSLRWF